MVNSERADIGQDSVEDSNLDSDDFTEDADEYVDDIGQVSSTTPYTVPINNPSTFGQGYTLLNSIK
jgi:hypothetical protein